MPISECPEFAGREPVAPTSRSRVIFYGICVLLFALSAAVTIAASLSMSTMGEIPMPGGWALSTMWMPMCGQTWPAVAVSFIGMWIAMMIAMMLPSFAPGLWRYGEALRSAGHARAALMTLLAGVGYFATWAVLGMALFALGAALAALETQTPALSRAAPVAASVIVLGAGALQFTAWKAHHLRCCRQARRCGHHALPSLGVAAMQYGLRLGVHCCYCCASLTAVLVVTGMMDLPAMVAVTAAITLERVAPRGEYVARGIGFVIIGAGLFMMARAAWLM